jgi:hypothetical protein
MVTMAKKCLIILGWLTTGMFVTPAMSMKTGMFVTPAMSMDVRKGCLANILFLFRRVLFILMLSNKHLVSALRCEYVHFFRFQVFVAFKQLSRKK